MENMDLFGVSEELSRKLRNVGQMRKFKPQVRKHERGRRFSVSFPVIVVDDEKLAEDIANEVLETIEKLMIVEADKAKKIMQDVDVRSVDLK